MQLFGILTIRLVLSNDLLFEKYVFEGSLVIANAYVFSVTLKIKHIWWALLIKQS